MTEQRVAEQTAPPRPLTTLDGVLLKRLFESGTAWLEHNVEYVNRLNVFPVPDGDTGTNMLLTMRSAMREVADSPSHSASEVAAMVAQGALMGARGNSGVILSQLLRGFSRAIEGKSELTTHDIAHAFQHASDMAYKAVMKPVEGTILTVARVAAERAVEAADETDDICELQEFVVKAAKKALKRTPDLLPVLKEAGVVDSGGQGLVAILDGMLRYLNGDAPAQTNGKAEEEIQEVMDAPPEPFENGQYGYDIQFLIRGDELDVDDIREYINSIGDCGLVVGDPELVKVHVHCLNPGPALDYGAQHGMLDDVVVENMDLQYQEFVGGNQHTTTESSTTSAPVTTDAVVGIGTVVVAPSDGLKRIFESLGASKIIAGGQTMNPSTQDILAAIDEIEAERVIVLPNNKNIIMAAQQAQGMSAKEVHIVPTRSIPQGIAAMMSINYSADIDTNLDNMNDATRHVVTAEITEAVRTTRVDGVNVTEGDFIGLLDGKLVAAGDDVRTVTRNVLNQVEDLSAYEIVTFFYGADVSEDEASAVVAELEDDFDTLEFDILEGGQPHYRYIFSIE